ncbi:hypothetical protein B0T16DRAFT_388004 [Cercophora newfieldiana]|uniref:Uncharacterized protein n=1 Tax=Cercophora newfieldiana TaxID=92897 RepID=A0AA39YHN1_9PEZI|nr:hypothetical protein B0T16DRAFT_388004 [Cercophora newfieldiana]
MSQRDDEVWRPTWLRRRVFVAFAACLEHHLGGLEPRLLPSHAGHAMDPAQPGPSPRKLTLDPNYDAMLSPAAIVAAFRNQHFLVAISTTVSLVLKAATVLASGLLFLREVTVTSNNVPFENTSDFFSSPSMTWTLRNFMNMNSSLPRGYTLRAAHQIFGSDMEQPQAVVQGVWSDLECVAAEAVSVAVKEMPDEEVAKGFNISEGWGDNTYGGLYHQDPREEIRSGYKLLGWNPPNIKELTTDNMIAALTAFYRAYPPLLAHLRLRYTERSTVLGSRHQRLRRLLVEPTIAHTAAGTLGSSALLVLLAAAFFVPSRSFVPCDPEPIAGTLALLGGNKKVRDVEHTGEHDTKVERSSWYQPAVLKLVPRVLMSLVLAGLIATLVFLFLMSEWERGIGVASTDYLRFLWSILPTLVMAGLSIYFTSADHQWGWQAG